MRIQKTAAELKKEALTWPFNGYVREVTKFWDVFDVDGGVVARGVSAYEREFVEAHHHGTYAVPCRMIH